MICIIPARGGSRRIPGKNKKKMLGVPLFVYSVRLAKSTGLFDKIIVTTDDKEIEKIAEEEGAEVHVRPKVSNTQTLKEVWEMFDKPLCCLLPNPLTKKIDLIKASQYANDVWSVTRIKEDPPTFLDAGQFYFIKGKPRMLYQVEGAVDINTPNDWEKALKILRGKK
jgi:CMP-N-acetylneuraminic acid synthetase